MPLKSKKYNLREKILTVLEESKNPISVKYLQNTLNLEYNKTSIYRQLESLFKAQKVHKIYTSKETLFEIDKRNHAHFECIKCSTVKCLDLPKEVNLVLNLNSIATKTELENWKILDTNISIKSLCQNCL